jgi:hypothetical protein
MKLCSYLANQTLLNHETHYHGAVQGEPEFLENYKNKKGYFIKKFLIGEEFNMNEWRVTWDAIKKDVWAFVGRPLVLTPDEDHPRVHEQDDFKVGEIIDVGIDELKRIAWQVSEVSKEIYDRVRAKKLRFGSPTVLKYSDRFTDENKLGNGKLQTTLHRFIPAHDALVAEPAYGKQVDKIKAVCKGDGKGCALKLREVSASVNSDNVDQLTIVPFIRKALKKNFQAVTLKEMVEYSKRTRQGSTDESCVSKKIGIIADEHPEWDHDKIIAVAYSYCKEKSADIETIILGDLTPEIFSMKEKMKKESNLQKRTLMEIAKLQDAVS